MKKMFVGNLPEEATEASVTALFSEFGTVRSIRLTADVFTGKCRGFGFIEMSSKEEGQNAIATLNGKEIDGRALTVNEAKPREERGGGGGNRGGGGGRGGYGGGGSRY